MQIRLHQNPDEHINHDEISDNEETYVKQGHDFMIIFDGVPLHTDKINSIEHLLNPTLCRRYLK